MHRHVTNDAHIPEGMDVKEAQALPNVEEKQKLTASSEETKPEIARPKKLMRVLSQQKEQQPQPSALAQKEKSDTQRESKPASCAKNIILAPTLSS